MVEFNPYSWEFHDDPYPTYAALREEAPAYRNDELGFWAISRHADVLLAFKDWETFSNAEGVALEAFSKDAWRTMSFLAMDPPSHNGLRGLVNKVFTPRRVREFEPRIRALANEYLDLFPADGRVDFMESFAGKLPMDFISEMIGVPKEDRDRVRHWVDDVLHREEGKAVVPPRAIEASLNLLQYYQAHVDQRRKQPVDDLLGALMAAEVEGRSLSDQQILSFLFLLGVAGNETTTKLLGNALHAAHSFPEQYEKVLADRALIPGWVEETARFDNSSQLVYRTLMRDIELHGKTLQKGDRVALLIGAANRDERVFPNPDDMDIERDFSESLSFGRGIHFCLGANLARMEGRVCCEEILRRYPRFEIDEAGLVRAHSGNVRGFVKLPVQFSADGEAQ
ncbi:MAG: cytochrome P450 [Deltaproteobacteria bacterium]|nr:cytochrome P450 [Deltaproteobacteria bacterium]